MNVEPVSFMSFYVFGDVLAWEQRRNSASSALRRLTREEEVVAGDLAPLHKIENPLVVLSVSSLRCS
jgi:hypothetical protein